MWNQFFAAPVNWQAFFLAAIPVFVVSLVIAHAVRVFATRLLRAALDHSLAESSPIVRAPLRLLGVATFLLLFGLLIFPAFELAGLQPRTGLAVGALQGWLLGSGLRLVLIVLFSVVLIRVTSLLVTRFEHEIAHGSGVDALERAKRVKTLGAVITKTVTTVITGVAMLMILELFSIDITPVLTGAGILGLAVGFGAQTLVRDVITGFLILLENQVRVGDVAAINGTGGLVEQINLRTIVLRDYDGTVHIFPNGAIATLSNRTKDYSYYVIDLSISYDTDPDDVIALLRQIGAELQADPAFGPAILAPIDIAGVDSFAESAIVIKLRVKTVPIKQWDVGRELRRRIKKTFAARGIELPRPQRVVTLRQEAAPGRA
jgi:small conductance mechanosensitive channel